MSAPAAGTDAARHVLRRLADNSRAAIADGVYTSGLDGIPDLGGSGTNLREEILARPNRPTLITEIKFASPSLGVIRPGPAAAGSSGNNDDSGNDSGNDNDSNSNDSGNNNDGSTPPNDPAAIASQMVAGGASALSVLTQPYLFHGSPAYFADVRRAVDVPMLMKDIVVDMVQIGAARRIGADYVLLIQSIFDGGHAGGDGGGGRDTRDAFIRHAHRLGLGVLLEVHTLPEFEAALDAGADLIGINNRNLDTLQIDLATTESILSGAPDLDEPVISESGIGTPEDIRYLKRCGADAFLIGSSIMAQDKSGGDDDMITRRVRRLADAY